MVQNKNYRGRGLGATLGLCLTLTGATMPFTIANTGCGGGGSGGGTQIEEPQGFVHDVYAADAWLVAYLQARMVQVDTEFRNDFQVVNSLGDTLRAIGYKVLTNSKGEAYTNPNPFFTFEGYYPTTEAAHNIRDAIDENLGLEGFIQGAYFPDSTWKTAKSLEELHANFAAVITGYDAKCHPSKKLFPE